jgi:hypothetical protein
VFRPVGELSFVETIMNNNRFIPHNILPMGIDNQNRLILWNIEQRFENPPYKITEITPDVLQVIAGYDAFEITAEMIAEQMGPKADPYTVIKNSLIDACRRNRLRDGSMIGQGVWRVSEYPGRMLIVSGNMAAWYMPDGTWENIEVPLIGDRKIDFNHNAWVDLDDLRNRVDYMTPDRCRETWDELTEIVSEWNFKGEHSVMLVVALLFSTAIQAFLKYRPQVWITGASGSSKSGFAGLMSKLWPWLKNCQSVTSEAAVRQTARHHSYPIILDEFEKGVDRRPILKLLRTSTTDNAGSIVKGTIANKPIEFRMTHCAWVFSIAHCLADEQANENRFAAFELMYQENVTRIRGVVEAVSDDLGRRVLAVAIRCANQVQARWYELVKDSRVHRHDRLGELYAVPYAMYQIINGESDVSVLDETLSSREALIDNRGDSHKVLEEILQFVPQGATMMLGQYLSSAWGGVGRKNKYEWKDEVAFLATFGIMTNVPAKYPNMVFFACSFIEAKVLPNNRWGGIKQILARIEGAYGDHKQPVPGAGNLRGVLIPVAALGLSPKPPLGLGSNGADAKPAEPLQLSYVPVVASEKPSRGGDTAEEAAAARPPAQNPAANDAFPVRQDTKTATKKVTAKQLAKQQVVRLTKEEQVAAAKAKKEEEKRMQQERYRAYVREMAEKAERDKVEHLHNMEFDPIYRELMEQLAGSLGTGKLPESPDDAEHMRMLLEIKNSTPE